MLISSTVKINQDEPSFEENRPRPLRNSDRIQGKFGSYGIDILENGPAIRVSNLYSTENGVKTNRTFAVVAYPGFIEPAFKKEHEAIIGGQSIGLVFEHNGWVIDKKHQYFGEIEVANDLSATYSPFNGIGTNSPAIHIYSLVISKDDFRFEYALIAEVHHPEYLRLEDLKTIYEHEANIPLATDADLSDFLQIVKTKIQGL